ncbi:hypothetical protein [Kibdelosporangium philippinense]|uniref:hypothetical protein n=1 Tax=Kibdelosporangium philippinense TaxID=211113 RepID=UPI003605EF7D
MAADHSGSSGEHLTDPQGVFAHASVRIDDVTAGPVLADLRQQADATQAPEAKFMQLHRSRCRTRPPETNIFSRVQATAGSNRCTSLVVSVDGGSFAAFV